MSSTDGELRIMLTIYGYPNSRSTRVVWALEEVGTEYEYVYVDVYKRQVFIRCMIHLLGNG